MKTMARLVSFFLIGLLVASVVTAIYVSTKRAQQACGVMPTGYTVLVSPTKRYGIQLPDGTMFKTEGMTITITTSLCQAQHIARRLYEEDNPNIWLPIEK